jgi:MFS family permease
MPLYFSNNRRNFSSYIYFLHENGAILNLTMNLNNGNQNGVKQSGIFNLSPNIFFLGIVSLLTDTSTEMIFTLVPLFLTNVLGVGTAVVGLVGGISDSTDAVFKIFSGWFSDRLGKRKPLAVLGYSLSTIVKPLMYLASSWGMVTAIRFGDRVGKGFRGSPRDALVADSVDSSQRGRAFGLHRAMDTLGAMLGLIIAALVIYYIVGENLELSLRAYHWLVLIGVIPAVLAVLVLVLFVHERKTSLPANIIGKDISEHGNSFTGFDSRFKLFLAIIAIFNLGNSSDFFIILRAQNLGSPVFHVTLMLVLFNAVYAAIALPAGTLSDRMGRRRLIILGWMVYALVYLGFALASNTWQIWLLFAGYGIYYGIAEGVARALVADLVPSEKRGTAYGLYHGVVGIALLPASLIAGGLWQAVSPSATFFFGAGLAFIAALAILVLIKE